MAAGLRSRGTRSGQQVLTTGSGMFRTGHGSDNVEGLKVAPMHVVVFAASLILVVVLSHLFIRR
eukprot:ANDGO_01721.mRNA.1 hypothetical protein